MLPVPLVHVVLYYVVISHHVEPLYHFGAAGVGHRGVAGGVEQGGMCPHCLGHPAAGDAVFHPPFLVAVAPEDDARVVAVAAYHSPEQAQMLLIHPGKAVLVNNENSFAVADVQQRGCHGVVRSAVGVAAQHLELADAPFLQRVRYGRAHAGMVLMQVYPLEFQRFAIEKEPPVCGEFGIPDADNGFVAVCDNAAALDGGEHLVQIRVAGVPEVGGADTHGQTAGRRLLWLQGEGFGA